MAIAIAALLAAAFSPVALAAQPEVPGNNGTVKIHEGDAEPASEMRNEPHVCTFHLHFFNADGGDSGSWEIQEWAPGDKGSVVLSGSYEYDAGGEDRVPNEGQDPFELDPGHYKLFWDGDLDTNKHDKHKVFWVECEDEGGEAPAAPTPTPPTGARTTPPSNPPGGGVGPVEGTPTPPTGGVAPTQGTPPAGAVAGAAATPNVTLPPTDTADQATPGSAGLWAAILLLIAVGTTVTLATVPAVIRGRRR
jgi:hypothetical protein